MYVAQSNEQWFEACCIDCGMTSESNDFDEVLEFQTKHTEHTDHEIEWTKSNFAIDAEPFSVWTVTCETCDNTWRFGREDEAQEHISEHERWTDHEIDEGPTEEPVPAPRGTGGPDDMLEVIQELEQHFETGVPKRAIYACLREEHEETAIPYIKTQMDELAERGQIYEPKTGYVETV